MKKVEAIFNTTLFFIYDGAKYAFANASVIAYEENAAGDSWKKTEDFLFEHLK